MGLFKGGALRAVQTLLYVLLFCCSVVMLAIFAFFLTVLHNRNEVTPDWELAVTGIAGAAAIYSLIAVVLTCCLAGITIFGIIGLLLDLAFVGASIAIAYYTRHGAKSCNNYAITPLGSGPVALDGTGANSITRAVGYKDACVMNKVVFAMSIITAVLFLVTALMQIVLMKNHKKNKREKAARESSYDAGYATEKKPKFWQRKRKNQVAPVDDYNHSTVPVATTAPLAVPAPHQMRASRDTGYTGSTAGVPDNAAHLDKAEKGDMLPANNHAANGGHTHAPLHNAVDPHHHGEQPYQYAPTTIIPNIHNHTTTTTTNTSTH